MKPPPPVAQAALRLGTSPAEKFIQKARDAHAYVEGKHIAEIKALSKFSGRLTRAETSRLLNRGNVPLLCTVEICDFWATHPTLYCSLHQPDSRGVPQNAERTTVFDVDGAAQQLFKEKGLVIIPDREYLLSLRIAGRSTLRGKAKTFETMLRCMFFVQSGDSLFTNVQASSLLKMCRENHMESADQIQFNELATFIATHTFKPWLLTRNDVSSSVLCYHCNFGEPPTNQSELKRWFNA